jgi:hypothetical protein
LRERIGENAFSTPSLFPNLLAAEGSNADQCPDGTIFIGVNLIEAEKRSTNGSLFSLPAVLAHEFAHTLQEHNRFPLYGKWRELHADFMAGYFIGHRERLAPQNVSQAAQGIFDKGDYEFNSPTHHGTREERASAFLAGYLLNKLSQAPSGVAAYNAGIAYIRSQGAAL